MSKLQAKSGTFAAAANKRVCISHAGFANRIQTTFGVTRKRR